MSIEATHAPGAFEKGGPRALVIAASVLVFAVFVAVTLLERGPERVAIRVVAPTEVSPGRPFPIAARVFEHEGAGLVRELEMGDVAAELREGERVVWAGSLGRSHPLFFEAAGRAPRREGSYELVLERGGAEVRRTIEVTERPSRAELAPLPASLRAKTLRDVGAPDLRVDVRVASGACVPEVTCEVFVLHDGEDARITPLEGVARLEPKASAGFGGSWSLVVRGLAARLEVEVTRGESRRSRVVALPIASGGVSVRRERSLLREGDSNTLQVESLMDGPHLFTHHLDGRLVAIGAAGDTLELEGLAVGVHRVQVGGDLFSPSSLAKAGASVFVVGSSAASARSLLEELTAREPDELVARALREEAGDAGAAAALAEREVERAEPPPVSVGEKSRDEGAAAAARIVGAGVIAALGALVAGAALYARRRERRALRSREGAEDLARASLGGGDVLVAAAIFLGYLLAAAVLLSRFWIFG